MSNYVREFGNFLSARMGPYIIVYFGEPSDVEVCELLKWLKFYFFSNFTELLDFTQCMSRVRYVISECFPFYIQ